MTHQAKSWRDVIPVHPAADLFPMMPLEGLKALGEDIKAHGLRVPIAVWCNSESEQVFLLDGRNRLDAIEMAGIPIRLEKKIDPAPATSLLLRSPITGLWTPIALIVKRSGWPGSDPYDFVISANIHRRHLTAEQKRDLIAKVFKANPEKSNRTIAKQTGVDDKTVAAVRAKLAATAEIPQFTKTVGADGKARTTAPKPKRRDVEGYIAEKKVMLAAKEAEAPVPVPQQIDIEDYIAARSAPIEAPQARPPRDFEDLCADLAFSIEDAAESLSHDERTELLTRLNAVIASLLEKDAGLPRTPLSEFADDERDT